jgi:hypothetical protein
VDISVPTGRGRYPWHFAQRLSLTSMQDGQFWTELNKSRQGIMIAPRRSVSPVTFTPCMHVRERYPFREAMWECDRPQMTSSRLPLESHGSERRDCDCIGQVSSHPEMATYRFSGKWRESHSRSKKWRRRCASFCLGSREVTISVTSLYTWFRWLFTPLGPFGSR